ncbi:MAG: N-acetyl-gamma-glutamyl-phosphate reductase [Pseudomonadota bacterium]
MVARSKETPSRRFSIGVVGARGFTGKILLGLIANHPALDLVFAASRGLAGTLVSAVAPHVAGTLRFEAMDEHAAAARPVDAVILATPDGAASMYSAAIAKSAPETVIIDLSADHRFDDDWEYGLPELRRLKGEGTRLRGARRIANPGCYATAMQLAIAPLLERLAGTPSVFGVSGYSGAGTTPNKRNDPAILRDNLLPYGLTGHKHEREATRHLGRSVRFSPHVHPAYRGLLTTVHVPLKAPTEKQDLRDIFHAAYGHEPLITLQDEAPNLRDGSGHAGVIIGGFETSYDNPYAVLVAAEDNLLKGAAVQAMQNLNLALDLDEFGGLDELSGRSTGNAFIE